MNKRAYALDALRGYAIITMVLSATVAWNSLPGWMYHAQTPPPDRAFDASLSGITWVDLVFPFFLFAMGAAFPFSIKKRFEKGDTKLRLVYEAIKRGVQLTFFAIFIQHFYPYVLSNPQDVRAWLLSILCFIILFPMFIRIPLKMPDWMRTVIKVTAYVIAIVLLLTTQYANERTFDVSFNNIIILLLANMAVFGSVIYIFTMYLMEWLKQHNDSSVESTNKWKAIVMILLTLAIIIVNLAGLYTHCTVLNLIINIPLLISGVFLLRKGTGFIKLWRELFTAGAFLVVLGLCFEPFQGGIKKDPATLSYLFLTSGLAFMALLLLNVICDYFRCVKSTRFLVMPGQNPMMAYVVGDLLIMPVINLLGIASLLVYFNENAWMGFLRGVVLTALSVLVTMFFTRIKCFWRT